MRERERHRADVAFEWNARPTIFRDQDTFEDCSFERRVVGDPRAVWVGSGRQHDFGDRLSRDPGLDLAVATGEADAENLRCRMFGVSPRADALFPFSQLGGAAGFDVPVEGRAVFGSVLACGWRIETRLRHDWRRGFCRD